MKAIELSNVKWIRTFGEMETYKYLGIMEADSVKQVERNNKIRKSIAMETKQYTRFTLHSRLRLQNIPTASP